MAYELFCSSIYEQQPGKFILDHCCKSPDSLGVEEKMGFKCTLMKLFKTTVKYFKA